MRSFHQSHHPHARTDNRDHVARMHLNQSMAWREPPVQPHPPVVAKACCEVPRAPAPVVANHGYPYDTRDSQIAQDPHGAHPSHNSIKQ